MFLLVGLLTQRQEQSLDPMKSIGLLTFDHVHIFVVSRLHIFPAQSLALSTLLPDIWLMFVYAVKLVQPCLTWGLNLVREMENSSIST